MQTMLSLNSSSHGLPLCLSGTTHPLSLSKEMADHDRRREAMKKQRRVKRSGDQGRGSIVINHLSGGEMIEGDLASIIHDLAFLCFSCTAKAA